MFTNKTCLGFPIWKMVVAKFPSSSNMVGYHAFCFYIPSTGTSFMWVLNTHTM